MARTLKDHRLETRAARLRLAPSKQPYWREISQGAHVGYFRGKRVGKWVARHRPLRSGSGYLQTTIGVADDVEDPDGITILDFREAQERARVWFKEVARGNPRCNLNYTVADALDDYMAAFSGKSHAATSNKIEATIRPALGRRVVADLTAGEISKWHRDMARSPALLRTSRFAAERNTRALIDAEAVRRRQSTANRNLTVLKAALNLAYRDGRVASDEAWRRVRAFQKVDVAKLRYLSIDEAQRLLEACPTPFGELVRAALVTGARYGDLRTLRVRDFDVQAGTLILPYPKGGRPYVVYLPPNDAEFFRGLIRGKSAGDLILTRVDGSAWGVGHQRRRLETASSNAKIDPVSFHDLRRTYGAQLAMQGVPMAVIAEAMGHADERITRRHYAHLAPNYVGDLIRRHGMQLGREDRREGEASGELAHA